MTGFWLGVVLFALGIGLSIALHEAGHFATAKAFGMKVTEFFVGFGPRVTSWRRGETEYGLKAIPAGGYVRITGMTTSEDVAPEDEPRAFWRQPAWKRAVVLVAGSTVHFVIALLVLFAAGLTTGLPTSKAVVGEVAECVVPDWTLVDGQLRECTPADPVAPARLAGLQPGDLLLSLDGEGATTYSDFVDLVRAAGPGPAEVTYRRDRDERTVTVDLVGVQRPSVDDDDAWTDPEATTETVGAIGILPQFTLQYGPWGSAVASVDVFGQMVSNAVTSILTLPEKVASLWEAVTGGVRDPESPVSVVGASRAGGQAVEAGQTLWFLMLLAGLNVFVGLFNLLPLPPLDGGHLALLGVDSVRRWLARRRGRAEPRPVDVTRLLPVTLVVIVFMGGLTVLAILADIVNPIANPFE